MASGTEMLMKQAMKALGLNPDDIVQTIEQMRQGLFDCINNQNEILAGNRRIEAKLDRLLSNGEKVHGE